MNETYNSVSKMMDALAGGEPLADKVTERIKQRKVVKTLQAMRMAKEIPQSRVAEELQCGQSRISKIEHGSDNQMSLGEVEAYARVLNCDVNLVFSPRGETAVERVKRHAMAIKRELDELATCAHQDEEIAHGVACFMGEAFFNLIRMVEKSCDKLPLRQDPLHPDNSVPYIKIVSSMNDFEQETSNDTIPANETIDGTVMPSDDTACQIATVL